MPPLPSPSLLAETLRIVPRRYRLPPIDPTATNIHEASPATVLATAIEQARLAVDRDEAPAEALKHLFTEALARMIHEAMRTDSGDPVFQAMVLRHRVAHVREYASLSARADQDRRQVLAAVNAIAHPTRQERLVPGELREDMARLHACASSSSWLELHGTGRRLLDTPGIVNQTPMGDGLTRLLDSPALIRLQRLEALASDDLVRQYLSLWDRHGPRSGTATAAAQGATAQQRGAAAEELAARALEVLARRLNDGQGAEASHRVVTSMRVPASIPATHERAKTEWDVVLLRQAKTDDNGPVWDVSLLVEVKASVDAATTDLPRLLRGLRLLAHADEDAVYAFETQQGTVRLSGAALSALTTDEAGLARSILYCCDAPAEATPRLLGAASRMQLLSAPASLEFASMLADKQHAAPRHLEPVWHLLLESPRWAAVLNQYPMLRQVRELMVHSEDLLAAIKGGAGHDDRTAAHVPPSAPPPNR